MSAYTIRQMDDDLWKAAQARAQREGRTMKGVLVLLLRLYARVGLGPLEAAAPEPQEVQS